MNYEDAYQQPIILFDGVCNLCSSSVKFVIKHDPQHHFRFASLQSDFGQSVLNKFNLPTESLQSFILLDNNKIDTASTAALKVVKQLNKGWSLLYAFIIVPPFIRNLVYQLIARNRYKWFGKKEICWVPSKELQDLFIS
jgi:predicted DCC family thiol-disulfide oxidoreductase YuxK